MLLVVYTTEKVLTAGNVVGSKSMIKVGAIIASIVDSLRRSYWAEIFHLKHVGL